MINHKLFFYKEEAIYHFSFTQDALDNVNDIDVDDLLDDVISEDSKDIIRGMDLKGVFYMFLDDVCNTFYEGALVEDGQYFATYNIKDIDFTLINLVAAKLYLLHQATLASSFPIPSNIICVVDDGDGYAYGYIEHQLFKMRTPDKVIYAPHLYTANDDVDDSGLATMLVLGTC
jgi:hypothetical protein